METVRIRDPGWNATLAESGMVGQSLVSIRFPDGKKIFKRASIFWCFCKQYADFAVDQLIECTIGTSDTVQQDVAEVAEDGVEYTQLRVSITGQSLMLRGIDSRLSRVFFFI
jgi:hypothetical protein